MDYQRQKDKKQSLVQKHGTLLIVVAGLAIVFISLIATGSIFYTLGKDKGEESKSNVGAITAAQMSSAGMTGAMNFTDLGTDILKEFASQDGSFILTVMTAVDSIRKQKIQAQMDVIQLKEGVKNMIADISDANYCRFGWERNDDMCYYISTMKKSWFGAQILCHELDAYLVEIPNAQTNNFIKSLITRKGGSGDVFYIGLSDISGNENWIWDHTKYTVDFTDWGRNQPNTNQEDCGTMDGEDNLKWHDYSCDTELRFICATKNI